MECQILSNNFSTRHKSKKVYGDAREGSNSSPVDLFFYYAALSLCSAETTPDRNEFYAVTTLFKQKTQTRLTIL